MTKKKLPGTAPAIAMVPATKPEPEEGWEDDPLSPKDAYPGPWSSGGPDEEV